MRPGHVVTSELSWCQAGVCVGHTTGKALVKGEQSHGQNWPPVVQPGLETALATGVLSMCFHANVKSRSVRSCAPQKTLLPLSDPCNLSFPEASLDTYCSVCKITDSLNHAIHVCFNHMIVKSFWNCHVW